MEQQPDKCKQDGCAEGLEKSFTQFAKNFAPQYNNAKYDNFHKEHRFISTFITLCFHCIGFGVLFLLHLAKNGADDVYTGFAEIVFNIF